ncbi:uncharacterized protein F5147DRAFT_720257 [Suillus discolor]|uniref:Uncharacterized protein n=1 Tax=Suillus discolor TaxID=1912936 RepID=A0A9P7EX58_9AGAM|nr:uncharacterized protein F5147DRAFT_720257 [Suillus discolor]KAG2094035.1 hypothetical protein F5147DRAFT_720257 [Suillus discolor]
MRISLNRHVIALLRLFHSHFPHIAQSVFCRSFESFHITFLTASSAAAGATRAMTALPPQRSCIGPCVSSKESLNCIPGTSPTFLQVCGWRCCGQAG